MLTIKEVYAKFNISLQPVVRDGWAGLVDAALTELASHGIDSSKIRTIKGKFGELRIYTDSRDRAVHDIEDKYMFMSRKVCEDCGVEGTLGYRQPGWIATLCQAHMLYPMDPKYVKLLNND